MTKFSDLNLNPKILRAIDEAGYSMPTPIQAVASNKGDPVAQPRLDDRGHVLVEFGADHLRTRFRQGLGQGAGARPDFEHEIAFADSAGSHDASQLVVVVKEVLAQPMLRANATSIEQLPDLGEGLHGGGSRSLANAVSRE